MRLDVLEGTELRDRLQCWWVFLPAWYVAHTKTLAKVAKLHREQAFAVLLRVRPPFQPGAG